MKTEKEKVQIISAFVPVVFPPEQEKTNVHEEDIVDTLIVEGFEQDEAGNIRPVVKQIVTGKKNRKAFIESFSDETGIENILKKIGQGAIAEDKYSILKSQKPGTVNDLTPFADINNMGDIQALADKARVTYAKLDPALKGNMSYKEFCMKFGNDDLIKYVSAKEEAIKSKKAEEVEDK